MHFRNVKQMTSYLMFDVYRFSNMILANEHRSLGPIFFYPATGNRRLSCTTALVWLHFNLTKPSFYTQKNDVTSELTRKLP